MTQAGDTQMGPILCFGNSHTVAIKLAHAQNVRQGGSPDDMAFVNLSQDPYTLTVWRDAEGPGVDPALKAMIEAKIVETAPRAILMLVGGNEHNIFGMFRHPHAPEPLDFVMPGENGTLAPDHRSVSGVLVRAELEALMRRVNLTFMEWLGGIAPCPVIVVTPPPPIVDADHLHQHPGVFADRMNELQLSPGLFRHKVWRLDTAIRRDLAARLGAALVTPPAEVFDNDGLGLGAAFRGTDPTHGNIEYGKLMLHRIRQTLDDQAAFKEAI